jgi:hypothetical protein
MTDALSQLRMNLSLALPSEVLGVGSARNEFGALRLGQTRAPLLYQSADGFAILVH